MTQHLEHQMLLPSLWAYWSKDEYINKFRNETRIKIIGLLQQNPEGLTDTEMGKLIGCYPNLNVNRPRRNDLSKKLNNKFNNIIIDSGFKKKNEIGNLETVWILSKERLYRYMEG